MKIVNRLYLLVLALSLFSAPALAALSGIETEAAQLKEVPTTYLLEAVVEATQKSTISAQTSGVVKEVYFDVNDFVRKGELVVLIDDTQQQADLRQARAARKPGSNMIGCSRCTNARWCPNPVSTRPARP